MLSSPWGTFLPVVLGTLHQSEIIRTPSLRFVIPLQRRCQAFVTPPSVCRQNILPLSFRSVQPFPILFPVLFPVKVSSGFHPGFRLRSRASCGAFLRNSSPSVSPARLPPCKFAAPFLGSPCRPSAHSICGCPRPSR